MLTHLYLVRHAHSTYSPNELSRPLSEDGLLTADTVTEILKKENIDIIYSSPYKRALQTVQGLANYLDQEVQIVEDLKERILAEKPVKDFKKAINKVWLDYDFSWSGGESNRIAQKRGVQAIFQILENHIGKNIVIGSHGNIMVLIMNYFDNKYDFNFWQNLEMPDIYKLTFNRNKLVNVHKKWRTI